MKKELLIRCVLLTSIFIVIAVSTFATVNALVWHSGETYYGDGPPSDQRDVIYGNYPYQWVYCETYAEYNWGPDYYYGLFHRSAISDPSWATLYSFKLHWWGQFYDPTGGWFTVPESMGYDIEGGGFVYGGWIETDTAAWYIGGSPQQSYNIRFDLRMVSVGLQ